MSHVYKARCDTCKYWERLTDPMPSYKLPGGKTQRIIWTFVWCNDCRNVRPGEHLPELLELERGLASTINAKPFVIEGLSLRLEWRRNRVSSARCLECGSTAIIPFEHGQTHKGNPKWWLSKHPECDGRITILVEPAIALVRGAQYSPEGKLSI